MLALTRPDAPLLVLPVLLYTATRLTFRAAIRVAMAGALPLALWEVFSLVYYGALVPNTAIAKLATGIPGREFALQGLRYLERQLFFDPISALCILAAAPLALVHGRRRPELGWLATGIPLYLIYLVLIGGDFMAGRFFTAPLVV